MLLTLVTLLCSSASAQQPSPKLIEAELPPLDPVGMNPDEAPVEEPQPSAHIIAPNPAPRPSTAALVRRDTRVATGTPPSSLWGRWTVVQVTDLGETEDFVMRMDRAAMALDANCKTVALIFDFGPQPAAPALPRTVEVIERRECYKGGLGRYLSELTLQAAASWGAGENGAMLLKLPEMRADATLVRLRMADGADLQTPPQWLGPEIRTDRSRAEYAVLTELPKRGKEGDPPAFVHLTSKAGQTLHLDPLAPPAPAAAP